MGGTHPFAPTLQMSKPRLRGELSSLTLAPGTHLFEPSPGVVAGATGVDWTRELIREVSRMGRHSYKREQRSKKGIAQRGMARAGPGGGCGCGMVGADGRWGWQSETTLSHRKSPHRA